MLPKNNRLKKRNDFKKVYKMGRRFKKDGLSLLILENNLPFSRFAFVFPKKEEKKAVKRNKFKRQISEIVRANLQFIKPGFDGIFLLSKSLIGKNNSQLNFLVNQLLISAKILK
jgi:ribonuclease P protein component